MTLLRLVVFAIVICGTFVFSPWEIDASVHEKTIYLTFDDGPSSIYTPQILDILKRENVKATFFVLGSRCTEHPELIRRMYREGHEIGNHGYSHHRITDHTPALAVVDETQRTDRVVEKICGMRPALYRPPEGKITSNEVRLVTSLGHQVILWNVDSVDWKNTSSVENIIRNVESQAHQGSVVLFHDGVYNTKRTVQALPVLIQYFRNKGYTFKTLPTTQNGSELSRLTAPAVNFVSPRTSF